MTILGVVGRALWSSGPRQFGVRSDGGGVQQAAANQARDVATPKGSRMRRAADKLKALAELKPILRDARAAGKRVVFTNGCFDILHAGHVHYLEEARRQGDVLVIGLNSDDSVRQLKGQGRPLQRQDGRATVLGGLEAVDYVTIFSETNVVRLLSELKPDVWAKGGDYTLDTLNQDERRAVESYGGQIALIPMTPGHSTTQIIHKVKGEAY
ncbi:MAG: D-glycero-beta-D-manno-heptose 1-phosphate adenylyltransferase [Armatimonadota bacterium]